MEAQSTNLSLCASMSPWLMFSNARILPHALVPVGHELLALLPGHGRKSHLRGGGLVGDPREAAAVLAHAELCGDHLRRQPLCVSGSVLHAHAHQTPGP